MVNAQRGHPSASEVLRLRDAKGVSRNAVARAAGVSANTLRTWENKGRCPWRGTLEAVATVLDADAAALDPACWETRTSRRYGGDPAGTALQRLRRAVGLSADDVARVVGTTRSAVGHWESGGGSPVSSYREALARLYGVDELPLPAKRRAKKDRSGRAADAD